jgi:hypothetical protein
VGKNYFAQPAYANAMWEVIAKHIIDVAQGGEQDRGKLSESAIQFLTAR